MLNNSNMHNQHPIVKITERKRKGKLQRKKIKKAFEVTRKAFTISMMSMNLDNSYHYYSNIFIGFLYCKYIQHSQQGCKPQSQYT